MAKSGHPLDVGELVHAAARQHSTRAKALSEESRSVWARACVPLASPLALEPTRRSC